jgi:hypothetical protein
MSAFCQLEGCDKPLMAGDQRHRICQMHRKRMQHTGSYERAISCKRCGAMFDPLRKGNAAYCSADCATYVPKFPRQQVCLVCGIEFESMGKAICSDACRETRRHEYWQLDNERHRRPVRSGVCPHCGRAFETSNSRQRHCTNKCSNRAAHSRRRVVEAGAYVEDVWRSKVYERDGFMCQLCHKPCKMAAVVPHPKAPTLDHIIPIAAGGTHEYANVQLAHFICNSRKGAGDAQLRFSLLVVA